MKGNFEKAVEVVLDFEGRYYENDPTDPGGETKFGISKKAYPDVNIKDLTEEQAKEIYYRDYWQKTGCDELSYPLDIVIFDTAVNMGIGKAHLILLGNYDWRDYLFLRIKSYADIIRNKEIFKQSGLPKRFLGWINRIIILEEKINKGEL